jgi:hypothetical protein
MPPKMPTGNFSAIKRTLASKYREAKSQVSQQNPIDNNIRVPEDQDMAIGNESNKGLGGFGGFYNTGGSNINDSEDTRDDFKAADQDIIGITISLPN